MTSTFKLTLTKEEKSEVIRLAERFVMNQAHNLQNLDETKVRILQSYTEFAKDFKATPELYISCSRVFIKLLRVQLQVLNARLDQAIAKYKDSDPESPPFEPLVLGRRKEDYMVNAITRQNICKSVVAKIQELVG